MAYRLLREFRQAFTRLDTPPLSIRHHPGSAIAQLGGIVGLGRKTVDSDKNYDTAAFTEHARKLNVTPYAAQNITAHRGSNIDGRTGRHDGYRISTVIRK